MNQRITRLTPLDDVLTRLDALVGPVSPRVVEVAAVVGRVLADSVSIGPLPALALALRDGWAVSAEFTIDASSYAPVRIAAARRIDVGEPLPPGTDAVIPLDLAAANPDGIEITGAVGPGDGVLPAGADGGGRGALLLAGRRVTRAAAAALAAARCERVRVREPSVRLVSSRGGGDAVIDAALDLIADEIARAGGRVAQHPRDVPLEAAVVDETADAVIVVGGTGGGRNDTSVMTLARCGRIEVHGIALTPGETAAFGVVGSRPVLLLPGRLDSALAVWLIVGRHLLTRLTGCLDEESTTRLKLARKIASPLGLAEVVPVHLRDGAAEPIASGYVPLSALAQADGFILVPSDSEGYPPGTEVVIRPWP
jgi:molybdopterin molybdotransferase